MIASTSPYSAMVWPSSRRSMCTSFLRFRSASLPRTRDRSAEANLFAPLTGEEMDAVGESDPVAARAHDERVCPGGVGEEADAAQELAVRDAGRRDDHLLRREVVDREDAVDVHDAVLARGVDLGPPRRPQLRLQLAAETAERGRRQHRLPGAADADG